MMGGSKSTRNAKVLTYEGVSGRGGSMKEASGKPGRAASCKSYKQGVTTSSGAMPCTDWSFK